MPSPKRMVRCYQALRSRFACLARDVNAAGAVVGNLASRRRFFYFSSTRRRAQIWEINPMSRSRPERLQVILSADELATIEEFPYHARMPSRAAAVRELLRRALASKAEEEPPQEPRRTPG